MTIEENIVQSQINAYNNLDIDEFLALYSRAIEIYNFSEVEPFIKGIPELRKIYKEVFDNSLDLKATIKNRIVFDNKVIDEEDVTGKNGTENFKVIVIYEVNSELITKITFIRKRLFI